jgi:hypothetical protein
MHDSTSIVIVRLPDKQVRETARPRLAFLSTVAGWLNTGP